jgi:uncharacterized phage protein (TIGR01671 family)
MKQREIKFRALDKVTGRMYGPDDQTGPIFYLNGCIALDQSWVTGDFLLIQYTGMKDNNKVEIYEGDRVRLTLSMGGTVTGEVVMRDGCYTVRFDEPIRDPGGYLRESDYVKVYVGNHAIEVIGNIHQHPELLK